MEALRRTVEAADYTVVVGMMTAQAKRRYFAEDCHN